MKMRIPTKDDDCKLVVKKFDHAIKQAAQKLDEYIRYRAGREGVEYALSPEFFMAALHTGCRTFFGVTVCGGQLIEDEQYPRFFDDWQKRKHLKLVERTDAT